MAGEDVVVTATSVFTKMIGLYSASTAYALSQVWWEGTMYGINTSTDGGSFMEITSFPFVTKDGAVSGLMSSMAQGYVALVLFFLNLAMVSHIDASVLICKV